MLAVTFPDPMAREASPRKECLCKLVGKGLGGTIEAGERKEAEGRGIKMHI